MKIILLGYPNRAGIETIAQNLTPEISKVADIVCSDFTGEKNLSRYKTDAVVVLGGDGSIFRAVNQMGENQRPLIAVNLGRLGFLADVALEELVPLLKLFGGKPLPVVPLMMYQCRILR
ncbi:MAG: NAD(+)/NADH kinase, partial [Thermoguttaceae bacterium]|nr:NAD(+)/NADH kinase [Thermoguttaceae bacterium]